MLKLSELGEVSFRMWKLGELDKMRLLDQFSTTVDNVHDLNGDFLCLFEILVSRLFSFPCIFETLFTMLHFTVIVMSRL